MNGEARSGRQDEHSGRARDAGGKAMPVIRACSGKPEISGSIHNGGSILVRRHLCCIDFALEPMRQAAPYLRDMVAPDLPSPDLGAGGERAIRRAKENTVQQHRQRERVGQFQTFAHYLPGPPAVMTDAQADGSSRGDQMRNARVSATS